MPLILIDIDIVSAVLYCYLLVYFHLYDYDVYVYDTPRPSVMNRNDTVIDKRCKVLEIIFDLYKKFYLVNFIAVNLLK